MARTYSFNGGEKTFDASSAGTVVFNSSELESAGVVAYHVIISDNNTTGNTLADINRVRVKANGSTFMDFTIAQLRAFEDQMGNRVHGTGESQFTIPFYALDAPDRDLADQIQFPMNSEATIEIDHGGSGSAGKVSIGWTKTTVPPVLWPSFIGTPMNISNGQVNARFAFASGGRIAGLGWPTTGLGRIRAVLSGHEVVNMPGPDYQAASTDVADMLEEAVYHDGVGSAVDPLFFPLNVNLPAESGASFVEIDAAGNGGQTWDGTAAELMVYALHAQQQDG